jgi:hypothetical protein
LSAQPVALLRSRPLQPCTRYRLARSEESAKAAVKYRKQIDEAYDRMVKSDVKYLFVIDNASLGR